MTRDTKLVRTSSPQSFWDFIRVTFIFSLSRKFRSSFQASNTPQFQLFLPMFSLYSLPTPPHSPIPFPTCLHPLVLSVVFPHTRRSTWPPSPSSLMNLSGSTYYRSVITYLIANVYVLAIHTIFNNLGLNYWTWDDSSIHWPTGLMKPLFFKQLISTPLCKCN